MAESYYLNTFQSDGEVDDIIRDSIQYIIDSLNEKIDDNFLTTLEIPYTIQVAMEKIRKVIFLATFQHDGNLTAQQSHDECSTITYFPLENIEPDIEPTPNFIDSWARGTVTTKKVVAEDPSTFRRTIPGAPTTPSVSSYKSSVNGRKKSSVGTRSRLGSPTGRSETSEMDKTGKIFELSDDLDGDFSNLNLTGALFDQLQKAKKHKAQGYVTKETEEKAEFDVIQEQLDKANKELGGKKFILDRYGKPVVVGSVKVDSLPPFSVSMGLNITTDKVQSESDNLESQDDISINDSNNNKKDKKHIRVAGSRSIEKSQFIPIISLATTLSGIDAIPQLSQGVTIKSNTGIRKGDDIPEDPKRMSKKAYLSKSNSIKSITNEGSTMSFNNNNNSSAGGFGLRGEKSMVSMMSDGFNNNSNSLLGGVSIESLPDMDVYEGGKKIIIEQTLLQDMSDEELGLGPIHKPKEMISDPVKKSKLPSKKSPQHIHSIDLLHGSPENGKPRDRDLPKNMRPVIERKHLPAPHIGEITGHGLTLDKFKEKNKLTSAYEIEHADNWHQDWRG